MATRLSTNWEGIPHTRTTANIVELRTVIGANVIRIDKASFRNAKMSGFFELASSEVEVKVDIHGTRTIEVQLGWFGAKPKKGSWAKVTILGPFEFLTDFSGTVFHNISGKRRDV
jgi:hypothetical protein